MTDKKSKADLQLMLTEIKMNFSHIRDLMEIVAEQYSDYSTQLKKHYDSLVQAGFTEQQALEIVKTQGWMPKQSF